MVPLYLAVVGAVLQFDSSDGRDGNFPSLLNQDDFELHVLVEYIGALLSGACMVSDGSVYTIPSIYSILSLT